MTMDLRFDLREPLEKPPLSTTSARYWQLCDPEKMYEHLVQISLDCIGFTRNERVDIHDLYIRSSITPPVSRCAAGGGAGIHLRHDCATASEMHGDAHSAHSSSSTFGTAIRDDMTTNTNRRRRPFDSTIFAWKFVAKIAKPIHIPRNANSRATST